jgi:7-cyano-7-deazaguanine synthase
LSYAAAIAVSIGAEVVYYGAHADDAAGRAYPDCTPEFAKSMAMAIYEGSGQTCQLEAPLLNMNKSQVVATGLKLKAPYHLTWSCYEGGSEPCGECGTCIDRAKAFEINGVSDPAMKEAE